MENGDKPYTENQWFIEAINLVPPEKGGPSPNLYIEEFYRKYEEWGNLENVCRYARDFFLQAMEYVKTVAPELIIKEERIVFSLINKDKNKELLENVPHRDVLDLTIIYRFIVESSEEGFYSSIITNSVAGELRLNEEELYGLALNNTCRILPPLVNGFGDGFYVITNIQKLYGASVIFYQGVLMKISNKIKGDVYIIPSSVHEVFAVSSELVDTQKMKKSIKEINEKFVDDSVFLSNQLYLYDKEKKSLAFSR